MNAEPLGNTDEFLERIYSIFKMDKVEKKLYKAGYKRFNRMLKIISLYDIPNKNHEEMYNKCTRSYDSYHYRNFICGG